MLDTTGARITSQVWSGRDYSENTSQDIIEHVPGVTE